MGFDKRIQIQKFVCVFVFVCGGVCVGGGGGVWVVERVQCSCGDSEDLDAALLIITSI